jgi:hypothetical protein
MKIKIHYDKHHGFGLLHTTITYPFGSDWGILESYDPSLREWWVWAADNRVDNKFMNCSMLFAIVEVWSNENPPRSR